MAEGESPGYKLANDIKSILRYLLPGVLSILQIIIAILITTNKSIIDLIPPGEFKIDALSSFTIILLAPASLGYAFHSIYFAFIPHIDYTNFVKNAEAANPNIKIKRPNGDVIDFEKYKIEIVDALSAANLVWMYSRGVNDGMKSIESFCERQADILHGIGTTAVGSIIALISWLFLIFHDGIDFNIFVLGGWIILIFLFSKNYFKMRNYIEKYFNSVLLSIAAKLPDKEPITEIYIS